MGAGTAGILAGIVEDAEAVIGAQPEGAMGHFANLVDLLRRLIAVAIWSQDAVANAEESGGSARENAAPTRLEKAEERNVGQMERLVDPLEAIGMTAVKSAIGRGPDVAAAILEDGADKPVGEPVVGAVAAETAVAVVEQTAEPSRATPSARMFSSVIDGVLMRE